MDMLTPEFFDGLIIAVVLVGLALAVVRLYADLRRPAPPERPYQPYQPEDITESRKPQ